MSTRKVISIDAKLCNGCGLCIPNCPEGAIQIIDNKARLVSDLFCDGLGACLGKCPQGAISIEEREALEYSETEVMKNIVTQGADTIKAHLTHLKDHGERVYLSQALEYLRAHNIDTGFQDTTSQPHKGCPGMRAMDMRRAPKAEQEVSTASRLMQWPVQLHLVNPEAAYFDNADLLVAADCVPFAFADFHAKLLQGRIVVIFCPKLDAAHDEYVKKLAQIFRRNTIKSITLVHMEVPCCFGVVKIVQAALAESQKDIPIKEYTITIKGELED